MMGLRRSFRQAGVRTVVSSLWSVQDEATARLMVSFYENLWLDELGKLEALRKAQLEMLASNRAEHGAGLPATWGAFVLDGDWR
jgi:CHAT domain-containing protein